MALEEIAVADIRKGQKIRWEADGDSWANAVEFTAAFDFDSWNSTSGTHYLIEDVPQPPPFEVPWGTVQRDEYGTIWRFFGMASRDGNVAEAGGRLQDLDSARSYAPFTRLYTVQELIDRMKAASPSGFGGAASVLSEMHRHGGI